MVGCVFIYQSHVIVFRRMGFALLYIYFVANRTYGIGIRCNLLALLDLFAAHYVPEHKKTLCKRFQHYLISVNDGPACSTR